MKRSQFLFPVLLGLLAFGSCAPSLYKHQQMLASCHTRNEVSNRIGLPDEEIRTKTTQEWIYYLDSRHDNAVTQTPSPATGAADTAKIKHYDKYLKFTFDQQGNVTGHYSNVADPVRAIIRRDEHVTAWGIVAGTLFLALVIYIDAVTKSEISF
jgi:hypothetical protein